MNGTMNFPDLSRSTRLRGSGPRGPPVHPERGGQPAGAPGRSATSSTTTAVTRGQVEVLSTVDEASYQGGTMGKDHPITRCHTIDRGRGWYTGLGHDDAMYAAPTSWRCRDEACAMRPGARTVLDHCTTATSISRASSRP